MEPHPPAFVGIDVPKAGLDSGTRPELKRERDIYVTIGIAALVARLKPLAPASVVVEATEWL